jgi:hypothetical protein
LVVEGRVDFEGKGAAAIGDRCPEDVAGLLVLPGAAVVSEGSKICFWPIGVRMSVSISNPMTTADSAIAARVRAARRRR